MDWEKELFDANEKPLDRLVCGYSNTSIFRKIAVVGDSLSSGEFETRDENNNAQYYDMYDYSWGQYIARSIGSTVYNFSRGGMTASKYINSFADEKGFWDKDKACQAYIIALGVNDIFNQKTEIGSLDDIDKNDYHNNKKTFCGNYAHIVSRYKEISPDAKFFFVNIPNDIRRDSEKHNKLTSLLYDLSEYFSNSYVIDLRKYGPVYNEHFQKKYFLYGHLNPMGYIFSAKLIDSYIDYIIRHNPEDFKNVGFINSGLF